MNQNVLKVLMNPIRIKIFLFIMNKQQATTAELAKELPEVPQASLYRHIGKMLKEEILCIQSENKIRGVFEKVYEIKNNPLSAIEKVVEDKDREQLLSICYSFAMSILMDFDNYLKQDDFDLKEDRVGFRSNPMYMTDQESDEFLMGMHKLISNYVDNQAGEGRRLRQYSYALIPADERRP